MHFPAPLQDEVRGSTHGSAHNFIGGGAADAGLRKSGPTTADGINGCTAVWAVSVDLSAPAPAGPSTPAKQCGRAGRPSPPHSVLQVRVSRSLCAAARSKPVDLARHCSESVPPNATCVAVRPHTLAVLVAG